MRTVFLAAVALAIAPKAWCAAPPQRLSVIVFNDAGASTSLLHPATEAARMAFRAAGLETTWRIAEDAFTPESDSAQNPAAERIVVLPKLRPSGNPGVESVMRAGYALPSVPHPRAYAFLDAVELVSKRTTRPEYVVLACILVHELGHLLGLGHEQHGAMRADLEGADMDRVTRGQAFDSYQIVAIRAAMAQRSQMAAASPAN